MGRGLITLHARGEEPGNVPMSVQDLIGVASYQFRKSHLGVFQTMRSYPEISGRLMMNQIGWNNMLMRLFKTKEKLSEPINAECGIRNSELPSNAECGMDTKKISDGNIDNSEFRIPHSAITDSSALSAPGAFSAPRAFSSYDHAGNKKSASRRLTSGAINQADDTAAAVSAETGTCCEETSPMMTWEKGTGIRGTEFGSAEIQNEASAVSTDVVPGAEQLQAEKETKTSEAEKKNQIRETDEKRTIEIPNQKNERTNGTPEEFGKQTTGSTETEITKTEEIREKSGNTETGSAGSGSENENFQTHEETGQSSPPEKEVKRTIDDLTAREKEVLSDIRRFPMFKDQFRKDIVDPEFISKYPKTAAVYRSVLAFLDSS